MFFCVIWLYAPNVVRLRPVQLTHQGLQLASKLLPQRTLSIGRRYVLCWGIQRVDQWVRTCLKHFYHVCTQRVPILFQELVSIVVYFPSIMLDDKVHRVLPCDFKNFARGLLVLELAQETFVRSLRNLQFLVKNGKYPYCFSLLSA